MTEKGSKTLQYVAVAAGNLNIFACGAILGWTSPILPKLMEDNPIASDNQLLRPITKDEASWIGSLVPLGVMLGSFISGYLGEWFGRKRGLLMSLFPFLVGWILVGTAGTIVQMYVGRFILGLGVSVPFTLLPMYAGEISEVSIRGALGSFLQLFITFGFLFSYAVGPFVSYTLFWLLCAVIHLSFFMSFMFMPESPYYLLIKGREAEAIEAMTRFRGKSVDGVRKEIEELQVEIDAAFRVKTSWKDTLRVKVNRKAILLTSVMMIFQEFTGIDVVLFYVENIFRDAGTKNTALSAIIIGFVQMVSSVLTPLIVDKSGRKVLLIVSSVGSGIMVGVLGAYFYMRSIGVDVSNMSWLPLTSLILYIVAYSVGWGPLPWAIMGEMFSPGVKPKASSICVFGIWTFSFLTTKYTPLIEEAYGIHVGFWLFSVGCAASIVFIAALFPETKGKTLLQIQHELGGLVDEKSEKGKKAGDVEKNAIQSAMEKNKGLVMDFGNVTLTGMAKRKESEKS